MTLTDEEIRRHEHEQTYKCNCGFTATIYNGDPYSAPNLECPDCGALIRDVVDE